MTRVIFAAILSLVFGAAIQTRSPSFYSAYAQSVTTSPVCSPARVAFLTGVDNHIGGIGTMYENIAPNQVGKPGYETYINNRVVTIAELLRDAGYDTLMSGKWHLSGSGNKAGSTPYDRGFEDVLTVLSSGAQHFNGDPYYFGGDPTFMSNDTVVPRPDNGTYSNDLYTNVLLDQIKNHKDDGSLYEHRRYEVHG